MLIADTEEQNLLRESIAGVLAGFLTKDRINKLVNQQQFNFEEFFLSIEQLALSKYFAEKPSSILTDLLILAEEVGKSVAPVSLYARLIPYAFDVKINSIKTEYFAIEQTNLIKQAKKFTGNLIVSADLETILVGDQLADELYLLELSQSEQIEQFDLTSLKKSVKSFKLIEQQHCADIHKLNSAYQLLQVSEMIGACRKALDLTLDYVSNRNQFGVAIGSFQAVQHKLADTALMLEALIALQAFLASILLDKSQQSQLALNSLLLLANENAPKIIENCIQAHGGIGFTWEYELHLYLRRVLALVSQQEVSKISDRILELVKTI